MKIEIKDNNLWFNSEKFRSYGHFGKPGDFYNTVDELVKEAYTKIGKQLERELYGCKDKKTK